MHALSGKTTRSVSAGMTALLTLVVVASASCIGTRTLVDGPLGGDVAPPPSSSPSSSVDTYSGLKQALAAAGFVVRDKGQTGGEEPFGVPTRILSLDNAQVSAYEYPNAQALSDVRAAISKDGYSVPTSNGGIAMVEWVATPHFFSADALLVLYLGDNHRILNALDAILGPQFAGG